MNRIKRNIPNAITCGNLLCGCLAIVKAFEGDLVWAAYLVGIAAVLDFFDGFLARLLKVSSPIGKDLDSLADMVTFGVVPGVVMFKLMHFANLMERGFISDVGIEVHESLRNYAPYIAFIIPIFSAVRLAKFNNDIRQTDSFIGLPTPANAIFICALPLILFKQYSAFQYDMPEAHHQNHEIYLALYPIYMQEILALTSCVLALLLIAPLPLFSLKFKSFGWKGNEIRFVFLLLSVLMLVLLQFLGIPLIIVLYILMSVVNNLANRSTSSK